MDEPNALLGIPTADYACPFADCGETLTCHPHEFDNRLQAHLNERHGGISLAQVAAEVAKSQTP